MAKISGNFFSNLFASLFGGNDADAEKKRQLKSINKKFSKTRYSKFYRFTGNEASAFFAKYMYEIYKAIYSAQQIFSSIQSPNILKMLVINYGIPEELRQLQDNLAEEKILEMSGKIPLDSLQSQVETMASQFSDYFSIDKISEINNMYNQLSTFKNFCCFDFFYLLRKFDKTLKEGNFTSSPKFERVNGEYLIDNVKDFISLAWAMPLDTDWAPLFKVLKAFRGTEPLPLPLWKKIISRLQSLKASETLEYMIKLMSSNPFAEVPVSESNANIVEPYIEKVSSDAKNAVQKLKMQAKQATSHDLSSQLFGGAEPESLKNYTEVRSANLSKKGLTSYIHAEALNYLKAFLIEIMKKDMRDYYDLVVVRGQWENRSLSTPFSEGYNYLLQVSDAITQFDEKMSDTGPVGIKVKTLLPKTDRDSSSKNIVNRIVSEANDTAYSYIVESLKYIISMGKTVKALVDDYPKKTPEIISNWKELDRASDEPMNNISIALYKKIYLFASLLKNCMQSNPSDSNL